MSTDRVATYSYAELADRIEEVLGDRPSLSTLRAAGAKERASRTTELRPRLTAGMPSPLPRKSRTTPAAFPVDAVERWLSGHPRRAWNAAMANARSQLAQGQDTEVVVAAARSAGLSWQNIATVLSDHDGRRRSRSGVHKRFRQLADRSPSDPVP